MYEKLSALALAIAKTQVNNRRINNVVVTMSLGVPENSKLVITGAAHVTIAISGENYVVAEGNNNYYFDINTPTETVIGRLVNIINISSELPGIQTINPAYLYQPGVMTRQKAARVLEQQMNVID